MFTNNTAAPAATPSLIADFVKNNDPAQCSAILDELFFEWVGSEGSDDTDKSYRAKVAHNYRELKQLLSKMETSQEVNHD